MNDAQFAIAEASPRHHARGKVLNQHIDLRYDRADEFAAARLLDIDGKALFRVIVLEKVRALRARLEFGVTRLVAGGTATIAVWRQLQLDDLGAQLGHYPRASRARDELGDVEHAIARQHRQFGAHSLPVALIRKGKPVLRASGQRGSSAPQAAVTLSPIARPASSSRCSSSASRS